MGTAAAEGITASPPPAKPQRKSLGPCAAQAGRQALGRKKYKIRLVAIFFSLVEPACTGCLHIAPALSCHPVSAVVKFFLAIVQFISIWFHELGEQKTVCVFQNNCWHFIAASVETVVVEECFCLQLLRQTCVYKFVNTVYLSEMNHFICITMDTSCLLLMDLETIDGGWGQIWNYSLLLLYTHVVWEPHYLKFLSYFILSGLVS